MSDDDSKDAAKRLAFIAACAEAAKEEAEEATHALYSGQYNHNLGGKYSDAASLILSNDPQVLARAAVGNSGQSATANGASLAQLGVAAQSHGQASTTYAGFQFSHPSQYAYPSTAFTVVHHFTGAPKNEVKSVGCGQVLVSETAGNGFRLVGLTAATDINDVTCCGCLRALIAKGK